VRREMTLLRIVARVVLELLIIWMTMMRQSWQTTTATPRNRSAAMRCSTLDPLEVENVFVVERAAGLPLLL